MVLNYIDPPVGDDETLYPFDADLESLAQEIATAIRATRANTLITHGSNGEYGHPAHQLMHRACKLALQTEYGSGLPMYTISADFPDHPRPRLANKDDPADFIIDVASWLPVKLAAAECHKTQGALFLRRSSQEAGRQLTLAEVLMKVEGLHLAWPTRDRCTDDLFSQFLRNNCSSALLYDGLD
jgi:LmbE family N-acetylglucosaminyl deacetylase